MFKKAVKRLLPWEVFSTIRKVQSKLAERKYAGRDIKYIFTHIYEQNVWGGNKGELFSGSGSHTEKLVDEYIEAVQKKLGDRLSSSTLFDCGCGDLAVGSKLIPLTEHYIGGDIVEMLIVRHTKNFPGQKFINYDVSESEIPDCDIIVSRQVLQHLPNNIIQKFVEKLNNWSGILIFTDHQPYGEFTPNLDSKSFSEIRLFDPKSAVILEAHPFQLKFKYKEVIHEYDAGDGFIRTFYYEV